MKTIFNILFLFLFAIQFLNCSSKKFYTHKEGLVNIKSFLEKKGVNVLVLYNDKTNWVYGHKDEADLLRSIQAEYLYLAEFKLLDYQWNSPEVYSFYGFKAPLTFVIYKDGKQFAKFYKSFAKLRRQLLLAIPNIPDDF